MGAVGYLFNANKIIVKRKNVEMSYLTFGIRKHYPFIYNPATPSADEDRETSLKALQKLESAHRMKTFVTKLIQKSGSL